MRQEANRASYREGTRRVVERAEPRRFNPDGDVDDQREGGREEAHTGKTSKITLLSR